MLEKKKLGMHRPNHRVVFLPSKIFHNIMHADNLRGDVNLKFVGPYKISFI